MIYQGYTGFIMEKKMENIGIIGHILGLQWKGKWKVYRGYRLYIGVCISVPKSNYLEEHRSSFGFPLAEVQRPKLPERL